MNFIVDTIYLIVFFFSKIIITKIIITAFIPYLNQIQISSFYSELTT